MMFDFLKPQKGREQSWRLLHRWERWLHWLFYGLPYHRCYWCGRWFWTRHPSSDEYCSRQCCDEEMDRLDEEYEGSETWLCDCGRFNEDPWCCVCGIEPPYGCLSDACTRHDPEPEPWEHDDPYEFYPYDLEESWP